MTIRDQIAAWPQTVLECGGDPSNWWEPRLATADAVIDALVRSAGDAEVNAIRDAISYQEARRK